MGRDQLVVGSGLDHTARRAAPRCGPQALAVCSRVRESPPCPAVGYLLHSGGDVRLGHRGRGSRFASSSRSRTGSTSSARASAMSWALPDESDRPRSVSSWWYPPERRAMNSCAPTARAAASTSASPASGARTRCCPGWCRERGMPPAERSRADGGSRADRRCAGRAGRPQRSPHRGR